MWIPDDMKEDVDYQMSLTTNDDPMLVAYGNPYNPFSDFAGWWRYDVCIIGWDTCGLLARNVVDSDNETDAEREYDTVEAMKEIVSKYPRIFRMVRKSDYDDPKIREKISGPYGGYR